MKTRLNEAIAAANAKFPFDGYFEKSINAHRVIGEKVLDCLPEGSSILDIGSGPCDTAAVLSNLGYDLWACDDLQDDWHLKSNNRKKIMQFAENENIKFHLMTENDIPFENNSFDMVMCNDVLEHLHESPRLLVNRMMELLKPGGLLFITVPSAVNIRKRLAVIRGKTNLPSYHKFYWYPGPWRGHVREYVSDDLAQLATYLDLEDIQIVGCDKMLNKLPKFLIPLYLFVTKLFNSWKDSWLLIGRKKPGWIEQIEPSNIS